MQRSIRFVFVAAAFAFFVPAISFAFPVAGGFPQPLVAQQASFPVAGGFPQPLVALAPR